MSVLKKTVRQFFWKPNGCVSSLEFLDTIHGAISKQDVTAAVTGENSARHPLTVIELAGGKIVGDLRLAATADDVAIGGIQSLPKVAAPENFYLLRRRRFRMPKFWRGTALLLGAAASDNYYHWLLDSLPRWRILQSAGWSDYDWILLPGRTISFQDETLDRLGVPKVKRLRLSKNFVHQFERLVVPAMPFPPEEVSAWACDWVRSLFPKKKLGPQKIYLRRSAGRRRLVNEPELELALQSLGFVSVQPDGLTVAQQAEILSSARCVIAPHGASLTNLIFAPPGALLLELFHPQHKNRCYINLAAACGHDYAGLDGCVVNSSNAKRLEYSINIPSVLQTVLEFQPIPAP